MSAGRFSRPCFLDFSSVLCTYVRQSLCRQIRSKSKKSIQSSRVHTASTITTVPLGVYNLLRSNSTPLCCRTIRERETEAQERYRDMRERRWLSIQTRERRWLSLPEIETREREERERGERREERGERRGRDYCINLIYHLCRQLAILP